MYRCIVNIIVLPLAMFSIVLCTSCINKSGQQIETENKSSIKTEKEKAVFSNSLLNRWRDLSLNYLFSSSIQKQSRCFVETYNFFLMGDCLIRKSFVSQINKDSLLSKNDFSKGFYLVEIEASGSMVNQYFFIIRNAVCDNCSLFRFSYYQNKWELCEHKSVDFELVESYYNRLLTLGFPSDDTSGHFVIKRFSITRFYNDEISMYIGELKNYTPAYKAFRDMIKSEHFND